LRIPVGVGVWVSSGGLSEALYKVIGSIYKYVDDLVVLEYPRRLHRRSIDVATRLRDGRLVLLKVADDVENLSRQDVRELRDVALALSSGALVVANYTGGLEFVDEVAYEVCGVKAVNVNTLERVLAGEANVYIYQSGDMFKVKIDEEAMRRRRVEKGLSLGELAQRIRVSRRTVYEYERGYIEPTIDKAEKLVELLGEEILASVDIFESPKTSKHSVEEAAFDSREEEDLARRLMERNFRVVHAKKTTVDIVGSRADKKILLVVRHGRESFEGLKLKSMNSRRLARILNTENYVVVDDRVVKKDLEGEGIEAYTKNEVVELLNS
jgi:putative transcriptional regulator